MPMIVNEAIMRLRNIRKKQTKTAKDIGQTETRLILTLAYQNKRLGTSDFVWKKEITGVCLGSLPCRGMKQHSMS